MKKKNNDELPWECVYNHMPKWAKDLEDAIHACMPIEEKDQELLLLDEYNELTDKEERFSNEPSKLYGIEDRKFEIIHTLVGMYTKYKSEAEELAHLFKL